MTDNLESSVVKLKVIGALRATDVSKLDELANVYNLMKFPFLLGLAVQSSSSLDMITRIVELYRQGNRDINEQNVDGNTALHIAVQRSRNDVAAFLLSTHGINDTVANENGQTPLDIVPNPVMAKALQNAQNEFIECTAVQMQAAFSRQDMNALKEIFSNPRVNELLDINGINPDSGTTVLHDAAKAGNLELVQFILKQQGNPLAKDQNGKLPSQLTQKEPIKRLLNDAAKTMAILDQTQQLDGGIAAAPHMEGHLKKWTNITTGYKVRWFVLDNNILSYYKSPEEAKMSCRGSINMRSAKVRLDSSEKNRFEVRTPTSKFHLRATHASETNKWVWALQNSITSAKDAEKGKNPSTGSAFLNRKKSTAGSISSEKSARGLTAGGFQPGHRSQISVTASEADRVDSDNILINDLAVPMDDDDATSIESEEAVFGNTPAVSLDSMLAQLQALRDLFTVLGDTSKSERTEAALGEAIGMGQRNIDLITEDLKAYALYCQKLVQNLDRSEKNQLLWAQNVRELHLEHEKLEGQLFAIQSDVKQDNEDDSDDEFFDTREEYNNSQMPTIAEEPVKESGGAVAGAAVAGAGAAGASAAVASSQTSKEPAASSENEPAAAPDSTKSDAVPAASTASATATDSAETSKYTSAQMKVKQTMDNEKYTAGYENGPRKKLALDADNRPKISLWGILKNLIGKDMTRMTLPVTFNECTSLLQRPAEDMEYTSLLDTAAEAIDDPGLRMAYVAAFSVSSYSSTINRIAKPFNPLLGETFEYCRPDGEFRLISEQVSHHPPISAIYAESPRWTYYGESNVKSKFNGRSFDINPLGQWYLHLRPNKGADVEEEVYCYRKVTSSVVGIMVGNPVVDNYGTMEIKNLTTGYVCTLELKPRGWRGASAYKLEGTVKNANGEVEYQVGGAWDDKIYAKRHGDKGKLLLWQVHERPPAPFNLTPFAITLNGIDDKLREWLPPTDTRLRPDQRCMEDGLYDKAADEKNRVEEKQRAVRRKREQNGEEYRPHWFEATKHPLTGESYYKPVNGYWEHRAKQELKDGDIF